MNEEVPEQANPSDEQMAVALSDDKN